MEVRPLGKGDSRPAAVCWTFPRQTFAIDAEARAAVLAAGSPIIELDADARQAWVDAMKPVWTQFVDDVGQDNIDAAQSINAGF